MNEGKLYKLFSRPKFDSSTVVVVWNQDVGRLGSKVADYLVGHLDGKELGEISPEGFFSLGGVTVEDDVAQFPESKFYRCRTRDFVIFKSDVPRFDWHGFINLLLEISEKYFNIKQIYTIGGMVVPNAHTAPRTLLSVVNSTQLKKKISSYDIVHDMNYETNDNQRPTFSSYLLWAARARDIPGACLWVPVPFYLITAGDPAACKIVLEFLNSYLELGINFSDVNKEIAQLNQKIAEARERFPDLDGCINNLESNLGLTAEEGERLVKKIDELLRGSR